MGEMKKTFIENLPELARKETQRQFPEGRGGYVGASDGSDECERRVVQSRLRDPEHLEHNPQAYINFMKGHLVEYAVAHVFKFAGYIVSEQVEFIHPEFPYLRAHADFLFHDKETLEDSSDILVMQLKNPRVIPVLPEDYWVTQLHIEMGLVKLRYPKAAVTGSLFAFNLVDLPEEWDGYQLDEPFFASLIGRMHRMWAGIEGRVQPEATFNAFCGTCLFRIGCPAWERDSSKTIPDEIREAVLRIAENQLEAKAYKALATRDKDLLSRFFGKQRFAASIDGISVKHTWVKEGTVVKSDLVKEVLGRLHPELLPQVMEPKAGYWKLEVKPSAVKGGDDDAEE
jgi:hypothetical protein